MSKVNKILTLIQVLLVLGILAALVWPMYMRHITKGASSETGFYPPESVLTQLTRVPGGYADNQTYPRLLGDINGDRNSDIVAFGEDSVWVSFSNGRGFEPAVPVMNRLTRTPDGYVDNNIYPRLLGDVNGDGKADIVAFGQNAVWVALSNGKGFDKPRIALENQFTYLGDNYKDNDTYPRNLGDVNGDGKADIVSFGENAVWVAFSKGSAFEPAVSVLSQLTRANGFIDNNVYPRLLGDVNGDSRTDIVAFGDNAVYIAFSNGKRFAEPIATTSQFTFRGDNYSNNDTYPRFLGDVNGDGKADIVSFGENSVWVALSNGKGFKSAASLLNRLVRTPDGFTDNNAYPRLVGDVNGDGRADIVAFGENQVFLSKAKK